MTGVGLDVFGEKKKREGILETVESGVRYLRELVMTL